VLHLKYLVNTSFLLHLQRISHTTHMQAKVKVRTTWQRTWRTVNRHYPIWKQLLTLSQTTVIQICFLTTAANSSSTHRQMFLAMWRTARTAVLWTSYRNWGLIQKLQPAP